MPPSAPSQQDTNIVDTLQSLIVAFVLAMAFRGFVLEGFVIPTGSMAPTLMGQHYRFHSRQTGYSYPLDTGPLVERNGDSRFDPERPVQLYDPMLSITRPFLSAPAGAIAANARMGDRVLVLKSLFTLFDPRRFDVVVFKNPTDPVGATQNYIKRLVALPGEKVLLADGDVFTGPGDAPGLDELRVCRKPEFVQRAVWQLVYDSDYYPIDVAALEANWRRGWAGPPWRAPGWTREDDDRSYRWGTAERGELLWDSTVRPINDWTAYNVLRGRITTYPVSDVRVASAIEIDDPSAFESTFDLSARHHVFRFRIANGEATLSMRNTDESEPSLLASAPIELGAPGRPMLLEFWHVDQSLSIWIDGEKVVDATYDWTPDERLRHAMYGRTVEQYARDPIGQQPTSPTVSWSVEGSPLTLRRLQLDRDLYYRPGRLNPNDQFSTNGEFIEGLARATDPFDPLVLGEDQFFMLGDNSPASRDGRLWGRPHPLVVTHLEDETPFVVHRRLLLGKAWAVYFPAPLPMSPGGRALVPDFGRLRFIR